MKKKELLIVLTLVLTLLLTACGASSEKDAAYEIYDMAVTEGSKAEAPMAQYVVEEESALTTDSAVDADAPETVTAEEAKQYAEKIVYSGHLYIETTDFDASIAALNKAVEQYGGFVQDSNVSGRSNGDRTAVVDRYAYYDRRVLQCGGLLQA